MSYPKVRKTPGVKIHPDGYPYIMRIRGGKYLPRTSKRKLGRRPWEQGDSRFKEMRAKRNI